MDKGTILIVLVVVGLGGVVLWLLMRNSNSSLNGVPQTAPTLGRESTTGGYSAAVLNVLGDTRLNPSNSILLGGAQSHSTRKAMIAQDIGAAFGIPSSVTDTASKLDVSGYAVDYLEKGVSKVTGFLGLGSSKVGRATNGKDVFPNDMAMCAQRGATTVDTCGALFNTVTRKWPWQ